MSYSACGTIWNPISVPDPSSSRNAATKIKISPYSASHDHYNNKYPTSNLVDGNKNGVLDADYFAVAMHLTMKTKRGQQLPESLTPELIPPAHR